MVDIFALALSHGLLALTAIRLLSRPALDEEAPAPRQRARFGRARTMKIRPGGEDTGRDA